MTIPSIESSSSPRFAPRLFYTKMVESALPKDTGTVLQLIGLINNPQVKNFDEKTCGRICELTELGALPIANDYENSIVWTVHDKMPEEKKTEYLSKVQQVNGVSLAMLEGLHHYTSVMKTSEKSLALISQSMLDSADAAMRLWVKIDERGAERCLERLEIERERFQRRLEYAESSLQQLRECPHPEPSFDPVLKRFSVNERSISIARELIPLALKIAMDNRRYDLMSKVLTYLQGPTAVSSIDKPVFHYLLDKRLSYLDEKKLAQEEVLGGMIRTHAIVLMEGLRKAMHSTDHLSALSIKQRDALLPLMGQLQKALTLCAYWDDPNVPHDNIADEIIHAPYHTPIIIPAGNIKHAAFLAVHKTSDETATVCFYNTGRGVYTHPRHPVTEKFLTCLAYDAVPLSIVTDLNLWKRLEKIRETGSNEELYAIIKTFEEKGRKRSPPLESFFYEDPQMQGTCTAQGLMALLRHQLMEATPGTYLDKWGVYKFIKAHILWGIASARLPYLLPSLAPVVKVSMEKIESDLALFEIASDDVEYNRTLETMRKAFQSDGLSQSELSAHSPESDAGRYALLRHSLSLLVNRSETPFSADRLGEKPFKYADHLFEKKKNLKMRVRSILEEEEKNPESPSMAMLIKRMRIFKEIRQIAIVWLAERLPTKEAASSHSLFLHLIQEFRKNNESAALAAGFKQCGRLDLAEGV